MKIELMSLDSVVDSPDEPVTLSLYRETAWGLFWATRCAWNVGF